MELTQKYICTWEPPVFALVAATPHRGVAFGMFESLFSYQIKKRGHSLSFLLVRATGLESVCSCGRHCFSTEGTVTADILKIYHILRTSKTPKNIMGTGGAI